MKFFIILSHEAPLHEELQTHELGRTAWLDMQALEYMVTQSPPLYLFIYLFTYLFIYMFILSWLATENVFFPSRM